MKKMLSLIVVILCVSSCAVQTDHFINPLFYEELKAVSKTTNGWSYHLTPTSTKCTHPTFSGDGCEDGICKLIDQSETKLLFECIKNHPDKIEYPNGYRRILYFKIYCSPDSCFCSVKMSYQENTVKDLSDADEKVHAVYELTKPNCISNSRGIRIDNPTAQK